MSDAQDDPNRWSWVTPDGKTVTGAKGELMLSLRSERLPASTLVWRAGWAEWLPASRVTELKSVLPPGKAEPAQAPKLAPSAGKPATQAAMQPAPLTSRPPPAPVRGNKSQPPPAPVRGATSRPPPAPVRGNKSEAPPGPARGQELPRPNLTSPRVPSAAGPVAAGGAQPTRPRGASILGPPRDASSTTHPRAPLNTLGGEEMAGSGHTLRPPGAVPPPPRVGVTQSLGAIPRLEDELPTQRHLPVPSGGPASGYDAAPPTELRSALIIPTSTEAAPTQPGRPPDFDATLGSTPFEQGGAAASLSSAAAVPPPSTTLESAGPSLSTIPPRGATAPVSTGSSASPAEGLTWTLPVPKPVAIVLGVFLAGVLVFASGAFVFSSSHESTHAAADSSASAEAAPAAPPGCILIAPAARLATTVERSVQPGLTELVAGQRIAVGFASAPKTASGVLVRLDNLDAEHPFDESGDAVVRSIAPRVTSGAAKFSVDRAGGELGSARTLADGSTLGFAGPDLVRSSAGAKSVLYAGAASDKTTDPRVATSGAGTLVTFRRGGLSGQVLYGWVAPDGKAKGTLAPVNAPGIKFSGTPDGAANAKSGIIAFAGRPTESADWRVQLADASAEPGTAAKAFEPPAGGAGGGNIAPTVAAFGEDGWLLQWTEGAAGAYQVRMQRLGPKLEPAGEARLVSPKGANAGQGALLATGTRVLSVFVQTTAGHDELWGASFECH